MFGIGERRALRALEAILAHFDRTGGIDAIFGQPYQRTAAALRAGDRLEALRCFRELDRVRVGMGGLNDFLDYPVDLDPGRQGKVLAAEVDRLMARLQWLPPLDFRDSPAASRSDGEPRPAGPLPSLRRETSIPRDLLLAEVRRSLAHTRPADVEPLFASVEELLGGAGDAPGVACPRCGLPLRLVDSASLGRPAAEPDRAALLARVLESLRTTHPAREEEFAHELNRRDVSFQGRDWAACPHCSELVLLPSDS